MIEKRTIEQFVAKGVLVELYGERDDDDSFSVGRIISVSPSDCTVESISEMGLPGGFLTIRLMAIRKIQWGTRYLEQLMLLAKTGKWWERRNSARTESSSGRNLVLEELRLAKAEGAFVSLGSDSDERESGGLVEAIEGNNVVIKQINSDGECDGFTLMPLEEIAWIKRGGVLGNKCLTFYENRVGLHKEHKMSLVLKPEQKRRSKEGRSRVKKNSGVTGRGTGRKRGQRSR